MVKVYHQTDKFNIYAANKFKINEIVLDQKADKVPESAVCLAASSNHRNSSLDGGQQDVASSLLGGRELLVETG